MKKTSNYVGDRRKTPYQPKGPAVDPRQTKVHSGGPQLPVGGRQVHVPSKPAKGK